MSTYLLEFILAEKGLDEMFSSIGLLTEGIGMLEMPLSYSLRYKSILLFWSGMKLFKSIYIPVQAVNSSINTCLNVLLGSSWLKRRAIVSWADLQRPFSQPRQPRGLNSN